MSGVWDRFVSVIEMLGEVFVVFEVEAGTEKGGFCLVVGVQVRDGAAALDAVPDADVERV